MEIPELLLLPERPEAEVLGKALEEHLRRSDIDYADFQRPSRKNSDKSSSKTGLKPIQGEQLGCEKRTFARK